ncbi:DUF6356 family protein [Vineibacter terrae]|uniref:Capsule biosynthesis protein n=1 Tax=Vineibacter terrae TaxID=2586908 RepID=A0A5C8PBU2_9HYPH|nr:DUF6356 family protein [Vineibacter terrae]TXL71045.1 hypothetical protein FHP25_31730 [Vineibacter terrae]HEX2886602.1 DUF6356 family protein [Vineibacter terrae]
MRKLFGAFVDHPASVGESYGQHMGMAFSFGGRMILAGIACLLHGLLPFLFVTTGSAMIRGLHQEMVTHRRRDQHPAAGLARPAE